MSGDVEKLTPEMVQNVVNMVEPHKKEGPRALVFKGKFFRGVNEAECLRKAELWLGDVS